METVGGLSYLSAVNRIANTRRELPLSDEERLREALAKIERVRIELRLERSSAPPTTCAGLSAAALVENNRGGSGAKAHPRL